MERRRKPVSEPEPPKASTSERRRRSDSVKGSASDTSDDASTKAKRIQIIAAKEVEKRNELILGDRTDEITSPDVEFILRVKTTAASMRDAEDTDSVAATETTETTLTLENFEDLQSTVNNLRDEVSELNEKCGRLEKEKNDIINKRKVSEKDKEALEKTASEILKLRTTINELKCANEDVKDEKKVLQLEVKELKKELERRIPPEKTKATTEELNKKLQQAETLCEELMEENEDMKREMKEMEEELEELHDNFREDQASEYIDLKKELEGTTKNCRVLQFKLRKAERKCEQLEMERSQADERLKDLQATGKIDVDKARMKSLDTELSVAKEVSLKMHSELENLKETVKRLETDNETLRKQVAGEKANFIPSISELPSLTKEATAGKDYETLMRDLYDTMERETDLREQMRFAEDEIKTMRRKASSLEQENETLVMQIKKMATSRSSKTSAQENDELTPEELKLQFELCEQEMCVLRKKVDELEHENENFEQEIKYLQDKLINQPLTHVELPEMPSTDKSTPNIYFEQKSKLLEYEARELRRKLIEKERENERLQTEVEVHRRKASKVIVRSRSLDSELQVDLKRQLQLVEQEASILRQKTMDLETDNEKLGNENKRFQLRLSRKPPPGPADLMQFENIELKEKVQELERKMNTIKEELHKASGGSAPLTVIQDYKPRKESLSSDTESQLILSLKKTVKAKDDETITLNAKVTQLEIDNSRLNREYKKLKETLNFKKKPCRVVRETATRLELKEIIKELEDEITDLQVTVRGKETVHEDTIEQLKRTKKELDSVQKEMKQQIGKLTVELNNSRQQVDLLKSDATSQREKANSLQQQVERLAKDHGTDLQLVQKLQETQTEKETAEQKLKNVEDTLEKERTKGRELQNKLATVSALRDDLAKGSKLLETQRNELEKEVKQNKALLKKAEEQVKTFQRKIEETEKDLTSARKESNDLKNEIKEERSRLKQNDNRQTEVAVGWLKEREELKRLLSELRGKAETLQKQMEEQDKKSKETETRLRDEFLKRQEKAIKEAKTNLDAELKLSEKEGKSAKNKVTELTEEIEKLETSVKEYQEKNRHLNTQLRKEKEEWHALETSLEDEKRVEVRKRERLEREYEQERRQKEQELLSSRDRIVQLEREQRKMQNKIEEVESVKSDKQKQMEKELSQERQEYDDLTTKYEMLEEELVAVKARLVMEKEQVQGNFTTMKRDYDQTVVELQALRDTFNKRQDSWIKEKLDITERNKELKAKVDRLSSYEQEKLRWKDTIDEKESLIESYKKEERHLKEERGRLRSRVEELAKRVAELERAERASRTLSIVGKDSSKDSIDLRIKLEHSEQSHKADMAALRNEYEGRIKLMSQEMHTMQMQIANLANEKEDLKNRMEETESTMEEVKTNSLKRERIKNREEVENARRRGDELQKQLRDATERLEQAILENKNLKLKLETDRTSFQVQASELKSKINQLEERNLLESSRSSSRAYVKTRLELAWDKERQEQLRLLAETQAIVSELRDKVITLETTRDKEKQDSKRQLLDIKSLIDIEERGTNRRISELQGDMAELRDINNRLREQNDRLRKERERFEREREEWRARLFSTQDVHVKVSDLLEEVQKMATLVSPEPEKVVNGTAKDEKKGENVAEKKPKPPRRLSKTHDELRQAVEKIKLRTEELRKASANLNDERCRRNPSFRRAISATDVNAPLDTGPGQRWMNPQRLTNYPLAPPSMLIRPPPRQKSTFRKSLSLDQQLGTYDKIWDSGDDSAGTTPSGSQLSLRGHSRGYGYESDSSVGEVSLSSRASTLPRSCSTAGASVLSRPLQSSREGSIESAENVPVVRKPKKTLKEKLKAFKKKHSIEDSATGESVAQAGLASVTLGLGTPGTVVTKPEKEEKSIRSRITKALKKPLSRSSSLDRAASDREAKDDHSSKQSTLQTGDAKVDKKPPLLGRWGRTKSTDIDPTSGSSPVHQSSSQVRPVRQRSTETHL